MSRSNKYHHSPGHDAIFMARQFGTNDVCGNGNLPVTDGVWQAILSKDWREVLYRVSHCPSDASYRLRKKQSSSFSRGATCLHACALLRAPYHVTQRILEAFRPALMMQDKDGWTPLHMNLIYGNCEETTLLLIREGGPRAASIQAKYVGSPFHLACRHCHSMQVLRELLQQDPGQLKITTVEEIPPGRFPGDLIWHMGNHRDVSATPSTSTSVDSSSVMERLFLCLAALRGDWDDSNHSLHEVLAYQFQWCSDKRCCYLFQYLEKNPESVRCWHKGELPLHVAAAQPLRDQEQLYQNNNESFSVSLQSSSTNHESNALLSILLHHFPEAAAIPDQRSGRLALHHALACGRQWTQGLQVLIGANSIALNQIDSITGLFPAALAALAGAQVETIFLLLLACPSVLSFQ